MEVSDQDDLLKLIRYIEEELEVRAFDLYDDLQDSFDELKEKIEEITNASN